MSAKRNVKSASAGMTTIPSEHQEQKALFQWIKLNEPKYKHLELAHASMNAGGRNPRLAKESGIKAGVPDVLIPVPKRGFCGLFIEMKRVKGGVVSKEQKWFIEELEKIGYCARVCRGYIEAVALIKWYWGECDD